MIELHTSEFSSVAPLLAGIRQKVLPQAILQGHSPGRIFVDQRHNPRLVLVWSAVGYYFLAGEPAQAHDLEQASQVLCDLFVPASKAGGESGLILVPSHTGWKEYLPALLPERAVIEIYRRPFRYDPARFAALGDWRARVPPGFQVRVMDTALAERAGVLAGWVSLEAFLAHGLGVALLAGEEIASACASVFASDQRMEMDIHTVEKHRRRGFATLVAMAFIEACLQRGKQPNWECFWENQASIALAEKLGFHAEPDYPVYYWEE